MNFGSLLFSPAGRIGRMAFWVGLGIILAYYVLLNFLTVMSGSLMMLVAVLGLGLMVYMLVVVHAKRLHDIGRTGWWYGLVIFATLVLLVIALGPVSDSLAEASRADPDLLQDQDALMQAYEQAFGEVRRSDIFRAFIPLIAITLFAGIMPPKMDANRYGPPPAG